MAATKTKVKPGPIELDPVEPIVIVNYEKQTLDISGPEPVVLEKKAERKKYAFFAAKFSSNNLSPHQLFSPLLSVDRIKLKEFDQTSDVTKFAAEIMESCKYISPNKQGFLEDILRQLQV